jgi:hypothetical protein
LVGRHLLGETDHQATVRGLDKIGGQLCSHGHPPARPVAPSGRAALRPWCYLLRLAAHGRTDEEATVGVLADYEHADEVRAE